MTGTSRPVLEDGTVPPVLPVVVTLDRFGKVVSSASVPAVLDVLCFGHYLIYSKVKQIREVGWGRYPASTPLPRVLS